MIKEFLNSSPYLDELQKGSRMIKIICPKCGSEDIEEVEYKEFECCHCKEEFILNEASYKED